MFQLILFTTLYIIFLAQGSLSDLKTEQTPPPGVEFSYEKLNWGGQTKLLQPYLVLYPKTSQEVAKIVTWAYHLRKNVRVQGHSPSPLIITDDDEPSKTVLLDFTHHMKKLRLGSLIITNPQNVTSLDTIIAEPGASLEEFLTFAEQNDFGIMSAPDIGEATIGELLALGGHGSSIPTGFDTSGYSFGTLSNLITKFEAIVYEKDEFIVKTFTRSDPDASAFLLNLGRALITEVSLLIGKNYNLRCVSRVDIPARELFSHPRNSSGLRTMSSILEEFGRVEAIYYPFTESPWLKVWEMSLKKPPGSRQVRQPYNYHFKTSLEGPENTKVGQESLENVMKGLTEDRAWDIWGHSRDTILYENETEAQVWSGFVILTNRGNIQYVFHDIVEFYSNLLNEYHSRGLHPIDGYMKLQVNGVDTPGDVPVPGGGTPDLSPISSITSRPDFNIGVWMNCLTSQGKPYSTEFMKRMEDFAYLRFNGRDGLARPEWSKNWGYSETAPFEDLSFIKRIPEVFGIEKWNHAVETLDKYDPHKVVSNGFLRELLVPFQVGKLTSENFGWRRTS